jgi:hypothetical protein
MPEVSASEDQIARLRLIRSENIGPVTFFQLLARFGSAPAAIDAVPDLAARGGGRPPKLASRAAIEREVEQVARLGARYLFLGQGLYPPLLAEIETAPRPWSSRVTSRCSISPQLPWWARATRRPPPAASRGRWRRIWAHRAP